MEQMANVGKVSFFTTAFSDNAKKKLDRLDWHELSKHISRNDI